MKIAKIMALLFMIMSPISAIASDVGKSDAIYCIWSSSIERKMLAKYCGYGNEAYFSALTYKNYALRLYLKKHWLQTEAEMAEIEKRIVETIDFRGNNCVLIRRDYADAVRRGYTDRFDDLYDPKFLRSSTQKLITDDVTAQLPTRNRDFFSPELTPDPPKIEFEPVFPGLELKRLATASCTG